MKLKSFLQKKHLNSATPLSFKNPRYQVFWRGTNLKVAVGSPTRLTPYIVFKITVPTEKMIISAFLATATIAGVFVCTDKTFGTWLYHLPLKDTRYQPFPCRAMAKRYRSVNHSWQTFYFVFVVTFKTEIVPPFTFRTGLITEGS